MSDEDDFFHPRPRSPVPAALFTALITTVVVFFALRALDARGLLPTFARLPVAATAPPSAVESAIEVPSLLGLRPEQARASLNGLGLLLVLVGERSSSLYGAGTLAEQTPLAGSQARPGTTVQAFVSSGPKQVRLPNLVGLKDDDATRELAANDLVAAPRQTAASDTIPAGVVIETEPVAGTALPAQAVVTLVVSSGPSGKAVPKVIGLRLGAAHDRLEAQGFKLGKVRQQANADRAPGVVLTQQPAADALAAPGTAVDLTINEN